MANALTRAIAPTLTVIDGQPTTTSTDVARHFGKLHKNVMQAIETLLPQLSAEHGLNFQLMVTEVAIGSGAMRQDPAYRITKKGFTLLAFGFTGKKALQFKLDYIDEFERLEVELSGNCGQLPGSVKPPVSEITMTESKPEPVTTAGVVNLLLGDCLSDKALMDIANAANRQIFQIASNNKNRGYGYEVAERIKGLSDADLHAITVAATMETWMRTLRPTLAAKA